ncbi:MAG: hypothetical protein GF408_02590 [Candidatus Omnitrophica bacterium]|nr:hypothetical protein [Candidatus Omnitrophota bacterium]
MWAFSGERRPLMQITETFNSREVKFRLGYEESVSLLRKILSAPADKPPLGFVASSVDIDNYKRLFTRDAVWAGLAALLSGEDDLIKGFRTSLETLIRNQRKDGAVPSNVSYDGKVSYGIINPRVDPNTLFIIGCVQYFLFSKDQKAFEGFYPAIEKAVCYLEEVWEDPKCGLLYIPRAGNWADEYLQEGFVLYDEVLWYMALRKYAYMLEVVGDKKSQFYYDKAGKVKNLVRNKFWIKNSDTKKDRVYEIMRRKIDLEAAGYLMHFFYVRSKDPEECFRESHGIFDAFGNSLSLLTGVASRRQAQKIVDFIGRITGKIAPLVPAHYPFFQENTFRSKKLHQYRFKEHIGHYHNGGSWPWYTGVYVAALVKMGKDEEAENFLEGIRAANANRRKGYHFYEYQTAKKSVVDIVVNHPSGLDIYFSRMAADFVSGRMSNVQIQKGWKRSLMTDPMAVREFSLKEGDKLRITAVGPDAEEVLCALVLAEDRQGLRYFREIDISSVEGRPDGTPNMGISAAAYIIAYKAVKEKKVLFHWTSEDEEKERYSL